MLKEVSTEEPYLKNVQLNVILFYFKRNVFGPQLMNVHCKPSLPLKTSLFLNFIDSYRKKTTETQTNTIAVHIAFWSTNEMVF